MMLKHWLYGLQLLMIFWRKRKDNAKQLSDLLTAIELLKESPLDEGGAAGAYILKFVRANDLHNK